MKSLITKGMRLKAFTLLVVLVGQMVSPLVAHALTGGPSQPEVQSFEPVGTSEMVDVFSGDFNYNIPLLDVNGYPINIAYHAGASMDEEASWVGLGWNINPGTINRTLRGLPDDMNGELVKKELDIKKNWTIGLTTSIPVELFGKPIKLNGVSYNAESYLNLGVKYNNYKGLGYNYGLKADLQDQRQDKWVLSPSLNLGYSDDGGISIDPNLSLSKTTKTGNESTPESKTKSFTIGSGFSSTQGVSGMNLGYQFSHDKLVSETNKRTNKQSSRMGQNRYSNMGLTYSNAMAFYTPGISTPMNNLGFSFDFKAVGLEAIGIHSAIGIGGYYNEQSIPNHKKQISKEGYGYLYEQDANQGSNQADRDYLLDYQRINDQPLSKVQLYLGEVNHTYDMYSVAAQGVGGTYRLQRNDMPILHSDYQSTQGNAGRYGVEAGAGNILKAGGNIGYSHNSSKAGMWLDGNSLSDKLGFVKRGDVPSTSNPQYESGYFREANEMAPQNDQYLALVGGEDPVNPVVFGHILQPFLEQESDGSNSYITYGNTPEANIATDRTVRNKMLVYRTVEERGFCLNRSRQSYPLNSKEFKNGNLVYNELEENLNENHIAEISILNTDGSRHIFSLPAYNNKQVEKSFRVGQAAQADKDKGQIRYSNGDDMLGQNEQGIDHYYSSTETPAYAHSYLLSGVVSPDYVDLAGDGITDDDLGSAVKFNYTMVHQDYKWRAPYDESTAKYDQGRLSDKYDNQGSYVYGEKEMWHLHSIVGKTHVAFFEISPREDGLGVKGVSGGKEPTSVSYKLDKITLYSKQELQAQGSNAVPIKTVHFVYDYELCPGVENSSTGGGKLTLQEIYFTYGKSQKGKFNGYEFNYNNDTNVKYHLAAYDRWGTYSPARAESGTTLTNGQYPYTVQDQDDADTYAGLWNLSQIFLPSGGVINVSYEADDYAYVQDKRAMRMIKITNLGRYDSDNEVFIRNNELYSSILPTQDHDLIFFELDEAVSDVDVLKHEYFEGISQLQVTCMVDINKGNKEFIKTYAEVDTVLDGTVDCGILDNGTTGWVRIKQVNIRDNNKGELINPITKAAFQYTRLNLNYLINPDSDNMKTEGVPSLGLLQSLAGFIIELSSLAAGHNPMLKLRSFCRTIDLNKSWLRLNDPDKVKFGGGHRVKQISMSDEWATINSLDADAITANYGQVYDYTIEEESAVGYYTTISSGVAAYEPMIGRDENPFVYAEFYDQKRKGVPDIQYTYEHPIGESYFPGASVGYSKITVKSLSQTGQATNHRTGYQVSTFYTYKDFPIQVHASDIEENSTFYEPRLALNLLLYGQNIKKGTAAQGYTIVLNDMHGKPKGSWSYNEYGTRISGVRYDYKIDEERALVNDVMAIQSNGDIASQRMGVNVDFAIDARQAHEKSFSANLDLNVDAFALGLIPWFTPTVLPFVGFSSSETRTASSTKVVRKSGILERTVAYKDGSEIASENLLYDASTGDVLLTSVENEFGDTLYSFNYPAHWAYDAGMGQAFKNWGLELDGITFSNGEIYGNYGDTLAIDQWLVPGDECLVTLSSGERKRVWVHQASHDRKVLLDAVGRVVDDSGLPAGQLSSIRVVNSGRRNMANVSIGTITCLENPMKWNGTSYELNFSEVLASSAVEYSDQWATDLSLFPVYSCDTLETQALTDILTDIDTNIVNDVYRDNAQPNGIYTLNVCQQCPAGYTYNAENDICEKILYQEATYNGSDYATVYAGVNLTDYNKFGTRFYENISDKDLPIVNGATNNVLKDGTSNLNVDQTFTSYYWSTRMNTAGVWAQKADQNHPYNNLGPYSKWIGFAECIEVPESKTYYMAVAADNYTRISINGNTYVELQDQITYNFNYLHVFPIDLEKGKNIIELMGLNTGQQACFVAEIYDATISELSSVSSDAQLVPYQIFSTEDMIGGEFTVGESTSKSGYSCPSGYAVDMCSDEIQCVSIERVAANVCPPDSEDCKPYLYFPYDRFSDLDTIIDYEMIDLHSAWIRFKAQTLGQTTDTIIGMLYAPCDTLFNCNTTCSNTYVAKAVNPYRTGLRGNWRPNRSWTYIEDRSYDTLVNPRADGAFATYSEFWSITGNKYVPTSNTKWVWTSEVTSYSPFGMELENMDPLGRYSAAIYGYGQTLPVAVASNTRYHELWYEGFEEYSYLESLQSNFICPPWSDAFEVKMIDTSGVNPNIDNLVSHSGYMSLKISSGDSLVREISLDPIYNDQLAIANKDLHFVTDSSDHIKNFAPEPNHYYVVSAWVHEAGNPLDTLFDDSYIEFEFENQIGVKTTEKLKPDGLIIEEWQRIEATILVPEDAVTLRVKFKTSGSTSWYDDIRIFPSHGSMKSYAYDHRTLRLMAEMDENNYATFYEYDLEGNLVRIKKETEQGVKTIQESRQHSNN